MLPAQFKIIFIPVSSNEARYAASALCIGFSFLNPWADSVSLVFFSGGGFGSPLGVENVGNTHNAVLIFYPQLLSMEHDVPPDGVCTVNPLISKQV